MAPTQLSDIDFEAVFSFTQLQAAERQERLDFGRRVTLLVLTKSKEELVATVRTIGAEPYAAWLDHIDAFRQELNDLLELSESARARLIVAGQAVAERCAAESSATPPKDDESTP